MFFFFLNSSFKLLLGRIDVGCFFSDGKSRTIMSDQHLRHCSGFEQIDGMAFNQEPLGTRSAIIISSFSLRNSSHIIHSLGTWKPLILRACVFVGIILFSTRFYAHYATSFNLRGKGPTPTFLSPRINTELYKDDSVHPFLATNNLYYVYKTSGERFTPPPPRNCGKVLTYTHLISTYSLI